jgi:hypothetical protein
MNRYTVVGSAAECEPGSNGLVLRNRLGITDPEIMGSLEQNLLLQLYEGMFINGAEPHRLTVEEAFASAHLLPDLLEAFQREQLNRRTRWRM